MYFICGLFNDAVGRSGYINWSSWTTNEKLIEKNVEKCICIIFSSNFSTFDLGGGV